MWPDARMKDMEMFSHVNLNFDLTSDKITVETAAKDFHGVPHYQYIYDSDNKSAVEITNFDEETISTQPQPIPATTTQTTTQQVPQTSNAQ